MMLRSKLERYNSSLGRLDFDLSFSNVFKERQYRRKGSQESSTEAPSLHAGVSPIIIGKTSMFTEEKVTVFFMDNNSEPSLWMQLLSLSFRKKRFFFGTMVVVLFL
jgi:hypothetical protein